MFVNTTVLFQEGKCYYTQASSGYYFTSQECLNWHKPCTNVICLPQFTI